MVFRREADEDDIESNGSSDFAKMLDESFSKNQKKLKAGDKVRAEVLSLGRDHIIVSTGTPNDGLIPRDEMLDKEGNVRVAVGDKIDAYVIRVRGTEIEMSGTAGGRGEADDVMDAYSRGVAVDGKVEEAIKGGFQVSIMGKRAFCPISQMDTRHIEATDGYIGKKFEFRITQVKNGGRDIVVSRRRLLEEQKGVAQTEFLSQKQVGDVVTGTITRLEKFGAFVEIAPGIEGLAHISELSWSRVGDPKDVVEQGQQVTAKILKIENAGGQTKISLSMKQVQEQPWLSLPAGLEEGKVLEGKVTRCLKFGAFVELFPGIEGLIPLSEMSYTKRVAKSDELVKEGEKVLVKIKTVDAFARRISLSLRDAEGSDPWSTAGDKFGAGIVVDGTVERREAYGLFISIGEGVTGLFPKSKANEHPEFGYDRLRPGDKVKVRIAEIKTGERRVSLEVPSENGGEDWKTYESEKSAKSASTNSPFGMLAEQMKAALTKTSKK